MENVGTPILWPLGIFDTHLVYLMAIWYILWSIGVFLPVLVYFAKINLAAPTLRRICT
jgi:hypothetical protein